MVDREVVQGQSEGVQLPKKVHIPDHLGGIFCRDGMEFDIEIGQLGTKGQVRGLLGRTGDGAVYDGAIFQLNGHRLIVQFHQKPRRKGDKEKNMNETNRRVRQILAISTLHL